MDRRFLLAMLLFIAIIVFPSLLFERPAPAPIEATDSVAPGAETDLPAPDGRVEEPAPAPAPAPASRVRAPSPDSAEAAVEPTELLATEDTLVAQSALYRYQVSTRGGRVVGAELLRYRSMAKDSSAGMPLDLLLPGSDLLGLRLLRERDTVRLDQWAFQASPQAGDFAVTDTTTVLLTAEGEGVAAELQYRFDPTGYQIAVSGQLAGIGPNGALLLVGMGPGLQNTEADSTGNAREMGIVTKHAKTSLHKLSSLDPGTPETLSGPFEWVALKSKYFVTAILAFDSGAAPISGVTATPPASAGKKPAAADIWASIPVGPDGHFQYRLYAGPMEYSRLAAIGHDFDDVNPYGWPGFRTVIRPVAVGVRWLLVWMHQNLHMTYGLVLVVFGVMVRVILWPLNQKGMRASLRMQAIQPLMKEIQEKYKSEPQRLQQEVFKLYKEHNVNPFGGCWPVLLPLPVLFALFFVFLNTIELRGVPFLWLPDLARPDPLYIIPVLMGLSMWAVSKIGQMGVPPNPQMKMMLYVMPVMMTVLFVTFPSGLNLYYTVSNIVSIPQQWFLAKERVKAKPPPPPKREPATPKARSKKKPKSRNPKA